MDGRDGLAAVLAVRVLDVRVCRHGPRSVQCQHRRDVLELGRRHQAQQAAHGTTVELEHPERVTTGQQLESGDIGQRKFLEIEIGPAVLPDVADGVVDDGEVPQAQEVHFQQAHILALREWEARDNGAVRVTPVNR